MTESPVLSSPMSLSRPKKPRSGGFTPGNQLGHDGRLGPDGKFAPMPKADDNEFIIDANGEIQLNRLRLMYADFKFFMSELKDDAGNYLTVSEHHEEWCDLMEKEKRLCLLAPRDHGKTWTSLCYIMWRCWKHNRNPDGTIKTRKPDGNFQIVLFSDTRNQVSEFFSKLQMLILANEELFADILPTGSRGSGAKIREVWTGGMIRFRNGAEVSIRAFMTSTRGLHPQIIICDDILNDQNSATSYQRAKVWRYFVGTIMPMPGPDGQLIIIGTAQHYSDLLHRLKTVEDFKTSWKKYRAVDWDTGDVLWNDRHNLADLKTKQSVDPVIFAKEFQNDPRDDASSLFPMTMTSKVFTKGAGLGMAERYIKRPGEFVVLSADMAMSEAIGADYCVVMVARIDLATQQRQLLWAVREKGWSFDTQVKSLRYACALFDVDLGVVESNNFQRWVRAETEKYPETAGKILGHTTGAEKVSMKDGVPLLTIPLNQGLWTFPDGVRQNAEGNYEVIDQHAKEFATVWQSEMNSFGWVNDKLQGAGEHDDTVMAFWLLERAVRILNQLLSEGPSESYVTMSEMGMERLTIGDDW